MRKHVVAAARMCEDVRRARVTIPVSPAAVVSQLPEPLGQYARNE